jgi:hypothetical protein
MTVDGGVIIYGVGEDKARVNFFEHPIDLQGVNDRISNTVVSNVQERPAFDVRILQLDNDPAKGFVLVDVPASPRAPHMVEVKGEYRFYGRVPGGNVQLTQSEIAQLYERRRQTEDIAREIVDAAIAVAPLVAEPLERGDLHLVARPLLPDSGIRKRAYNDDDGSGLAQTVLNVHNTMQFKWAWHPHLADILQGGTRAPTMDGVTLLNLPSRGNDGEPLPQYYSRLELLDSGLMRYFRAAIAGLTLVQGTQDQWRFEIRDPAILQLAAQFAQVVGTTLRAARYQGLVDLYVAVEGAKTATSAAWAVRHGGMFPVPSGVGQVATDDFRNEVRVSVDELHDQPTDVATRLLQRLLRTIKTPGVPNPLELH